MGVIQTLTKWRVVAILLVGSIGGGIVGFRVQDRLYANYKVSAAGRAASHPGVGRLALLLLTQPGVRSPAAVTWQKALERRVDRFVEIEARKAREAGAALPPPNSGAAGAGGGGHALEQGGGIDPRR